MNYIFVEPEYQEPTSVPSYNKGKMTLQRWKQQSKKRYEEKKEIFVLGKMLRKKRLLVTDPRKKYLYPYKIQQFDELRLLPYLLSRNIPFWTSEDLVDKWGSYVGVQSFADLASVVNCLIQETVFQCEIYYKDYLLYPMGESESKEGAVLGFLNSFMNIPQFVLNVENLEKMETNNRKKQFHRGIQKQLQPRKQKTDADILFHELQGTGWDLKPNKKELLMIQDDPSKKKAQQKQLMTFP